MNIIVKDCGSPPCTHFLIASHGIRMKMKDTKEAELHYEGRTSYFIGKIVMRFLQCNVIYNFCIRATNGKI